MKSLLFTAILSLRKRSEQILIKFAIPLQVRLTHALTFFRGVSTRTTLRSNEKRMREYTEMAGKMSTKIIGVNTGKEKGLL